jgi:F0F1-type ATP synthase membrane subunit b/b'
MNAEDKIKLNNRTVKQFRKETQQEKNKAADKVKNVLVKDLAAYLQGGPGAYTRAQSNRMASAALKAEKEYNKKLEGARKQGATQSKYPTKGKRK